VCIAGCTEDISHSVKTLYQPGKYDVLNNAAAKKKFFIEILRFYYARDATRNFYDV
jgi:hypothetical protein